MGWANSTDVKIEFPQQPYVATAQIEKLRHGGMQDVSAVAVVAYPTPWSGVSAYHKHVVGVKDGCGFLMDLSTDAEEC
jgi:hypothetical protein